MTTTLNTGNISAIPEQNTQTEVSKGTLPMPKGGQTPLWKSTRDIGALLRVMAVLADETPVRLSSAQIAFFLAAANAQALGDPATSGEIGDMLGKKVAQTVRSTYLRLCEPTEGFPDAVGWLVRDVDPNDGRRRLLTLSEKGIDVINSILVALRGPEGIS